MAKKKKGVVRLPSDDLPSQEGGWVEMQKYLKTKDLPYIQAFDPVALVDPEATIEEKEKGLEGTYRLLGRVVTDWNWKDPDGDAYPKPLGNAEVFGEIKPQEFDWLVRMLNKTLAEQATVPKQTDTP
jgi:hypothetical protein